MFKTYDRAIEKILSEKQKETDWKKILKHHKRMIARIQHERLIHLLVTVFVGICLVLCFLASISVLSPLLSLLDAALLILFVAYIFHYRFLENTTQKWYKLEDEILKNL